MGIVRMGPPTHLILTLLEHYQVDDFIETGTFQGKTALWAASHFRRVKTIEYSRELYDEVITKHSGVPNIDFVYGDSRTVLSHVIPELSTPAIFWLDSHWCGGRSYGVSDQCPILDELQEINKSTIAHFIFIDDARLFTSPPPSPNRAELWPTVDRVVEALQNGDDDMYILIFEDVIVAVPGFARAIVRDYVQGVNTVRWKEHGEWLRKSRESGIRRGPRLMLEGFSLFTRDLFSRLIRVIVNRRS